METEQGKKRHLLASRRIFWNAKAKVLTVIESYTDGTFKEQLFNPTTIYTNADTELDGDNTATEYYRMNGNILLSDREWTPTKNFKTGYLKEKDIEADEMVI